MGKWEEVLVKDISKKIQYGYTGKTNNIGKYRYLRITDIQNQNVDWERVPYSDISKINEIEKYLLKKGDLVFARTGATVGKSFLIKQDVQSIFASYLIRVQPKPVVDIEFLYHFFQSENYWQQIRGHEVGAAQPNVNGKKLGELKIPLPPLAEQKKIVAKLDELFERIDKSISLLVENIQHTKDLMASVLDEEFKAIVNDELLIKKLSAITTKIGSGSTPRGGQSSYKSEGISLIRSMNVHDNFFKEKNLAFIDDEQAYKLKNVTIEKEDVLLNITGASVARCCIVEDKFLPARVNQHVSIIRLKDEISPKYLLYYLISPSVKNKLLYKSSGNATREAITKTMIENFEVPVVSKYKQIEIVSKIEKLLKINRKLISQQTEKLNHLKSLKSSLLDKAFKGELV